MFIKKNAEVQNDFMQLLDKVDVGLVNCLAKRPNFDILKILFAKRLILVEGPTEEMFINTMLDKEVGILNEIEVIAIGQKGYKTFLDIWLLIYKNDSTGCIGVVRDFDNQQKAKKEHQVYDETYENIFVRTKEKYTLEDDLAMAGDNEQGIKDYFDTEEDAAKFLKDRKADNMRRLCEAILYVALTRSKSDLILVIDKPSIKKFTDKQIEEGFAEFNIPYVTMEYIEKVGNRNKV